MSDINYKELLRNYLVHFSEDDNIMNEILIIAEPLLASEAFRRLESITFLGILSPSLSKTVNSPLFNTRSRRIKIDPGCRKSHSLGVAQIALTLTKRLNLSSKVQKYAVVWGLLHDIATWPLSHTGEPAFSKITHTSTYSLREMMITGSNLLPESLTVVKALKKMDIDPPILLSLFKKKPSCLESELRQLWQILQSPITPDSIEGTWRTGLAFGIDTPHPKDFQSVLSINLFYNIVLKKEQSKLVINFWRKKAKIYEIVINRPDIVFWESAWSSALKEYFRNLDIAESLLVTENELIDTVLKQGLPKKPQFFRYRTPSSYFVFPSRKRILSSDQPLFHLCNFLRKEYKREYEYRASQTGRIFRNDETLHEQQNFRGFFEGTEILY